MNNWYITTQTKPNAGRAHAVSFLTKKGKSWSNLNWYGRTVYFRSARLAGFVAWWAGADFISQYPYPKRNLID